MMLRTALERSWEGDEGWPAGLARGLTAPLSWVWRAGTAWRNARHDRSPGWRPDSGVVVSVGNLAVGGTGKTPFTSWVVSVLERLEAAPGIAVSGYGADEVSLHRRWHPGRPVVAARDRRTAIRQVLDEGARVVVLDDGFQHRAVARDLDIVLLAAEHRFPGPLLPSGPYREPPEALARADLVVVTRRTASAEHAREVAATVGRHWPQIPVAVAALEPGRWLTLGGGVAEPPRGSLLAVAAIARPKTFLAAVRAAAAPGTDVALRGFRDHHAYTDDDLRRLRIEAAGRTLVVTEKDAVKLVERSGLPDTVRVLGSVLTWDFGEDLVTGALAGVADRRAR